ncbi:MAG: hypothetical protein JO204_22245 [Alphaproteobacteria bacterium]|nr:hypothetical protein [Alphaproteobacteria bacterium]
MGDRIVANEAQAVRQFRQRFGIKGERRLAEPGELGSLTQAFFLSRILLLYLLSREKVGGRAILDFAQTLCDFRQLRRNTGRLGFREPGAEDIGGRHSFLQGAASFSLL